MCASLTVIFKLAQAETWLMVLVLSIGAAKGGAFRLQSSRLQDYTALHLVLLLQVLWPNRRLPKAMLLLFQAHQRHQNLQTKRRRHCPPDVDDLC